MCTAIWNFIGAFFESPTVAGILAGIIGGVVGSASTHFFMMKVVKNDRQRNADKLHALLKFCGQLSKSWSKKLESTTQNFLGATIDISGICHFPTDLIDSAVPECINDLATSEAECVISLSFHMRQLNDFFSEARKLVDAMYPVTRLVENPNVRPKLFEVLWKTREKAQHLGDLFYHYDRDEFDILLKGVPQRLFGTTYRPAAIDSQDKA